MVWSGSNELDVGEAARALRDGSLVAFPTETVYGLGADARNHSAVSRIFQAKGRPSDNPLIVHVPSLASLYSYNLTESLSPAALLLAKSLWPGPLTLVVPIAEKSSLASNVTAGLSSVGIRIPKHPVAASILAAVGIPIAAPSANTSGRPSPTTAEHVLNDLNGRILGIVDGGEISAVGVESTVVDATNANQLVVLRPGSIGRQTLEDIAGVPVLEATGSVERPRAPGMKYRHYAPRVPLTLTKRSKVSETVKYILETSQKKVGVFGDDDICSLFRNEARVATISFGRRGNNDSLARNLYAALRKFDGEDGCMLGVKAIVAAEPEGDINDGIGLAVLNRLRKAASVDGTQPQSST